MPKSLNEWAEHVWMTSTASGWHEDGKDADTFDNVPRYVANIHGEVSELFEAYRNSHLSAWCDKAEKMLAMGLPGLTCLEEEIADVLIRVLDMAHAYKVDVEKAVAAKDAYNATRGHRHGGKVA